MGEQSKELALRALVDVDSPQLAVVIEDEGLTGYIRCDIACVRHRRDAGRQFKGSDFDRRRGR
jgi:hypothetical protein